MVSATYLCTLIETFGMLNLRVQSANPRRYKAQKRFLLVQTGFGLTWQSVQMYSTLSRASRYLPEFIQTLLENGIGWLILYAMFFLNLQSKQLSDLNKFTETVFMKGDLEVIRKCHRQSNQMCLVFFILMSLAVLAGVGETLIPLSDSELAIRRDVYRTAHPERRLPYNMRIPFVDESESYWYEVLFALEAYILISLVIVGSSLMVSVIPVMIIHLRGQYEILAKYIAKIGQEHRDSSGYRIYYLDIERNDYVIKLYSPIVRGNRFRHFTQRIVKQRAYERRYVGQIIGFHRKLRAFEDDLVKFLSPFIGGLCLANNITISLCLYQIVASPIKLSGFRYFKFTAEMIALNMEYYFFCNYSEIKDDCHALIRKALIDSKWESCSYQTRRDLCMLLRRVQKSNHLRFYNGAMVLCRPFFLNVVRVAYNFVNFMRLRTKRV